MDESDSDDHDYELPPGDIFINFSNGNEDILNSLPDGVSDVLAISVSSLQEQGKMLTEVGKVDHLRICASNN